MSTTRATIYADNADGARAWVCASSDLPDKALVRLTRDDGHAPTRLGRNNVVLRVRAATTTDEVAAGDLVAPQWALDVLGVARHGGARGAGVTVELLPPSVLQQLPPLTEVHVTYVAHQSHRHWDEVATSTAFDAPGSWSSVWPGGVSKTVLSRMLPVMLRSRQVVVDRSVAVLDVLDVSMMFHVAFQHTGGGGGTDAPECTVALLNPEVSRTIKLVVPDGGGSKITSNSSNSISNVDGDGARASTSATSVGGGFLRAAFDRVTRVCTAGCAGGGGAPWGGVRSMLVSAPEGAGKSFLLSEVCRGRRWAGTAPSGEEDPVAVLHVSGKDAHGRAEHGRGSHESPAEEGHGRGAVRFHLGRVIQLLQPRTSGPRRAPAAPLDITSSRPLRAVLVIDDVDPLLAAATGTDDDTDALAAVGGAGRGDATTALAAYHLRQLLTALKATWGTSSPDHDGVVVVAATRLAPHALPRAHQGAPEFETVVCLPRPGRADRAHMLTGMLVGAVDGGLVLGHVDDDGAGPGEGSHAPAGAAAAEASAWAARLATLTAGYLPGDLQAIVARAVKTHLGQLALAGRAPVGSEVATTTTAGESPAAFAWRSMLAVVASHPPRQLRRLASIVAGVGEASAGSDNGVRLTWDDFGGYSGVKRDLQRLLRLSDGDAATASVAIGGGGGVWPVDRPTLRQYLRVSGDRVRGVVLHGPPGCGKSYLARVVASEARMNFVPVRSTELLSKYFGQTEASIRSVFAQARAAAPCVVFFDEFDALAYKRSTGEGSGDGGGTGTLQTRVLSTFLNELDGILSHGTGGTDSAGGGAEDGIIVLAACNDLDVLDEALLRPGRLQHHVRLDPPTRDDVCAMVRLYTRPVRCAADVSVDTLADLLAARGTQVTGAHVQSLCRRAVIMRIRDEARRPGDDAHPSVGMQNFVEALEEMFPEIAKERHRAALPAFEWTGGFMEGAP